MLEGDLALRLLALILAGISGASMAVQGALNSVLGKAIGEFHAAFLVHLIGAVILGAVLLFQLAPGNLKAVTAAPWWSLLGGPLSAVIIWGVLSSVGKIGVAPATTAILTMQIFTALFLDALGVTGQKLDMSPKKIVGAIILVIGAYLLLKRD